MAAKSTAASTAPLTADAVANILKKDFNVQVGQYVPLQYLPTNFVGLDLILGGGLPLGRMIELAGAESVGKSALSVALLKAAMQAGMICGYADPERTADINDKIERYGLPPEVILCDDLVYAEAYLEFIQSFFQAGGRVMVVDSIADLKPKAQLDADMDTNRVGLQAKFLTDKFCPIVKECLNASNGILIAINQRRDKVGVTQGSPETTPGGYNFKHECSIRLRMARKSTLPTRDGIISTIKVVKNKVSGGIGNEIDLEILDASGPNPYYSMYQELSTRKLVTLKGSWVNLEAGLAAELGLDKTSIGQGAKGVSEFFEQRPEIYQTLYARLLSAPA